MLCHVGLERALLGPAREHELELHQPVDLVAGDVESTEHALGSLVLAHGTLRALRLASAACEFDSEHHYGKTMSGNW